MAMPPAPPPLSDKPLASGLYVVSTPIGNLRDITLRALDVLAQADLVLAEDTRVTVKLLNAYGLKARLERYDEHAAEAVRPKVLAALRDGARVALVSDAGTPLISDPGYRLAKAAAEQGSAVYPIPGSPRRCSPPWPERACRRTASCSSASRPPRARGAGRCSRS